MGRLKLICSPGINIIDRNIDDMWNSYIARIFCVKDLEKRVKFVMRRAQLRYPVGDELYLIVSHSGSGKTALTKILGNSVGDYVMADLKDIVGRVPDTMERIATKPMFIIQDIPATEYDSGPLPIELDSSTLQEILRNDPISCTPKYKREMTLYPDCIAMGTTNRAVSHQNSEIYSRVEVWCTGKSFGTDATVRSEFVDFMCSRCLNSIMKWLWNDYEVEDL